MNDFQSRTTPLIERGIPVVPVTPGEKACKLPNWPALATLSTAQISKWNRACSTYNTAAVCTPDGICVLDADSPELEAMLPQMPETFTVRSAGRGLPHLYYTQTARSIALGNRNAKGLFDFQQHNKYVVGPGSKLADGRTYDVVKDVPPIPFPDDLADFIEKHSVAEKKMYGGGNPVSDDFDFDAFAEHYGITGDWDGNVFVVDACPGVGRKHAQSDKTGFLFDGTSFGWKCFAANCPCSDMSIGQVLTYLNQSHTPYTGPIWPDWEGNLPSQVINWTQVGKKGIVVYGSTTDYDAALVKFTQLKAGCWYEYPSRSWQPFKYVLEHTDRRAGWFSRAQTNVIAGSSGAGKTRGVLPILRAAERGETVYGRQGAGLRFTVIFADRGDVGNTETLLSLGLNESEVDIRHMPPCWGDVAVDRIQEEVEKNGPDGIPDVLFVEGADMLVEDPNKMQVVAPFMGRLNRLAQHYNIAIILSLGAGKKSSEMVNSRDKAYGSVAWQRSSAQMFILESVPGDKEDKLRTLTINHRNWKREVLNLQMDDNGNLIEYTPQHKEANTLSKCKQRLLDFIANEDEFTKTQARDASGLSGRDTRDALDAYVKTGHIKETKRGYKVVAEKFR